ncbi:hypothetical protein GJ744_001879 [Endocarpon pusillum]|uniref:Uncharacterized protein n=1 Tax=Endocarpon pusillum TaxID=364733 RepID=A0A8H7ASE3_9EURO|nr:hypothetical protein GJ744_001879 [Endocarpon pusillum]
MKMNGGLDEYAIVQMTTVLARHPVRHSLVGESIIALHSHLQPSHEYHHLAARNLILL